MYDRGVFKKISHPYEKESQIVESSSLG
jgi:hypothetical protein